MKAGKKIKIMPLGGLNEIGKNMTAIEYDKEIIVIDAGLKFPDEDMLGIDLVIPDITYLEKNKDKVKAIVFTHGHEDHIGGIPYVLKKINAPIYGTKLTLGLIENKLREHRLENPVSLNMQKPGDIVKFGKLSVEFIRVSHSIPDAVALCIHSPMGRVVHTGDFKIDFTPIDGNIIDLHRFAQLGSEGVLLLLAESTNVERPGFTMSESVVGETFEEIFRHETGRIIVASFASNVHRLQQIVNAARINGRKVAFSGRSMENVSNVAMELGYLKLPKDQIVRIVDIDKYPDNEIVVITTGSQGEPMSALVRMVNKEHRHMEIRNTDTVILSSSPIPGNEKSVKKIINKLYEIGAKPIYDSLSDIHVSGHAREEELKIIHTLVKPKFFMPVHGEYSHLKHHTNLAERLGMNSSNVFILENGNVLELDKETAAINPKKIPSGQTLIDGLGIGDVGNIVLRDRKHLAEDGLLIVVLAYSKEDNTIISGPDIVSRGFVYVKESEALMRNAKTVVTEALKQHKTSNIKEWSAIKNVVRDSLREYIYTETKRNPMILPIIMEV